MTSGKLRIRNHMTLEYDFTGVRILDSALVPVDWHLSIDLVAIDKKAKSTDMSEYEATMTYQKLYFWLDTNLPNIIMVDVSNEDDLYIANLSSNIMMYAPIEPYDDVIVQLLHSKLSVLAETNMLIGEMRLKGSDMSVQYTFDPADTGYNLPNKTADYYTEGKSRDEIPWWLRNDGFCFEFVRPEDTTLTDEELFKDVMDPMDEFDKAVKEASEKFTTVPREPARIVQVERWKPKKV
jgi:hypothetical protein